MRKWTKSVVLSLAVSVGMMASPAAVFANNYSQEIDQALNRSSGLNGINGINGMDLQSMDLETALLAVQSQRTQLLDQQLRAQIEEVQRRNNQIALLNEQLSKLAPNSPEAQNIKNQIDTLSNSAQLDMLRLQSLSNKRNEALDTMTNFIKKMQESRSAIIGNMR